MIKPLDIKDLRTAQMVFQLQMAAYLVEAKITGYDKLPPLLETLEELYTCDEEFYGFFMGEELAGAISCEWDGETATICRMMVEPRFFRMGIAGNLLTELEKRVQKATMILVSTAANNYPAKKLYQKHNFQEIEQVEAPGGVLISCFQKILG